MGFGSRRATYTHEDAVCARIISNPGGARLRDDYQCLRMPLEGEVDLFGIAFPGDDTAPAYGVRAGATSVEVDTAGETIRGSVDAATGLFAVVVPLAATQLRIADPALVTTCDVAMSDAGRYIDCTP